MRIAPHGEVEKIGECAWLMSLETTTNPPACIILLSGYPGRFMGDGKAISEELK
jgi:hypothetical protein